MTIKLLKNFVLHSVLISVLVLSVASCTFAIQPEESAAREPLRAVPTDKAVVLVHLVYENGEWSVGLDGVRILPCPAPSKVQDGNMDDPFVRVVGRQGDTLLEQNIWNPRLILVEDPTEQTELLDEVSFNYRFALQDGMEQLEFWENVNRAGGPSVVVDLSGAIEEYRVRGPVEEASCQQPLYKPDALSQ